MSEIKKIATKYIAPIEEAELICRMIEAGAGIKRPPGTSAKEALARVETEDAALFKRAAHAAMDYWRECINAANLVN